MSAVPSILQTGIMNTPSNMKIETSLLYPVSISQKRAKFVFDRKGVLNSNSRLQLRSFSSGASYDTAAGASEGVAYYGNPLLDKSTTAGAMTGNRLGLKTIGVGGANVNCVVSMNATDSVDIGTNLKTAILANPTFFSIVARKEGVAAQATQILTASHTANKLTLTLKAGNTANWADASLEAGNKCEVVFYDMTSVRLPAALFATDNQRRTGVNNDYIGWTVNMTGILANKTITASQVATGAVETRNTVSVAIADAHVLVKANVAAGTTGAAVFGLGVTGTLTKAAPVDSKAFYPIATGASSLIQSASLQIGGKRISVLEQVGQYNTIKHLAQSNEYRKQVSSIQEAVTNVMLGGTGGKTALDFTDTPSTLAIHPEAANASKFSVALSDLIPMLKGLRLPLFLMEQEVALVLEFTEGVEGKTYGVYQHTDWRYNIGTHKLDTENCIIMADYLHLPKEMAAIQATVDSGGGLSIPYDDILTIEAVEEQVAIANAGTPTVFQQKIYSKAISLAGKRVKSIIAQLARPDNTPNHLLGVYYSKDYQRPSSYNFILDGATPYYTNDIKSPAIKYNEVSKCAGKPLQVANQRYTFSNSVATAYPAYNTSTFQTSAGGYKIVATAVEGHPQDVELTGTAHYLGIKFGLNEGSANVMGKKFTNLPMYFKHTTERLHQNGEIAGNNPLRFYCAIQKIFNISKGLVETVDL
tara:strand:- start:20088 stop:22190 length:2103 start_codon:yes stop_codon:yes gene_type:complete